MSQQIQITGGAKVRNLEGVLTGTAGVVNSLGINVPDGIPQLDGSGKILVSQLPNSVMEYKGTWNAATNTPTLANGTGNAGDVYLCNVAGTTNFGAGPITFAVGDQVLYSGTTWEKASGATGTVTSVAVTESGDALTITGSPITTSGTINIGFAGTGSQYIKGDGTLATFPTTIDQAKRLITEVYNSTGATLTKGTVVYINGGHGNLPTITKAQANADNTSAQTYGVVQSDITNMNNGFVVVFGSLTDLDTQAYSVGTQLYLSGTTAGAWTSTKPSAPIHLVYVGIVVRSHPTQGVVEIRIQNGYELEELHDVAISSVANNDGIFYNSSTDLWENKTIGEVLGYTPANDSLVVHLAGTETITGAKTFSASLTAASTALFNNGILLKDGASSVSAGHFSISSLNSTSLGFQSSGGRGFDMILPTSGGQITIPNGSGTLALTSNLSSYVPYTGATTFVNLGTQLFYSGGVEVANGGNGSIITDGYLRAGKGIFLTDTVSGGQWSSGTTNLVARSSGFLITRNSGGGVLIFDPSVTYNYTFPAVSGTIALTSNLSSYLPLSGGTLTGNLTLSSASTPLLQIVDTTNSKSLLFGADDNNTFIRSSSSTPILFQVNGGDTALTLASNQTATFSNNIMIGAGKYLGYSASAYITPEDNIQGARVKTSGGFVVESAGATFSGAFGTSTPAISIYNSTGASASNIAQLDFRLNNSFGGNERVASITALNPNASANNGGALVFSVSANGTGTIPTEDMRITSSGNVGIGTTAPRIALEAVGTDAASSTTSTPNGAIMVSNSIASNSQVMTMGVANGSGNHSWIQSRNSTNALFYNLALNPNGGNVGIGTSSPDTLLHLAATQGTLKITSNSTSGANAPYLTFFHAGNDEFKIVGGGYLAFLSSGTTERMRITSGGNVLVNNTSSVGSKLIVKGDSTSSSGYACILWDSSSNDLFYVRNDGFINTGTRSVSPYNNSTSGRTMVIEPNGGLGYLVSTRQSKTNIEQLTDVSWLYKLNPVSFNYRKKDSEMKYTEEFNEEKWYGLIADEVENINQDLVFYNTKEDNSKELAGVEYNKIIAALIKSVQELKAEIDELKNK